MKKIAIIFVSIVCALEAYSQIPLAIKNPLPRAGESVELIGKAFHGGFESEVKLILNGLTRSSGIVQIMPIEIVVNGKSFTTERIEFEILDRLPSELIEGVWITKKFLNGQLVVIIEQRIPNTFSEERKSPNKMIVEDTSEKVFTEFNKRKFQLHGGKIERFYSEETSIFVGEHSVQYRVSVGVMTVEKGFDIEKLDESFFNEVPRTGVFLNDLRIK